MLKEQVHGQVLLYMYCLNFVWSQVGSDTKAYFIDCSFMPVAGGGEGGWGRRVKRDEIHKVRLLGSKGLLPKSILAMGLALFAWLQKQQHNHTDITDNLIFYREYQLLLTNILYWKNISLLFITSMSIYWFTELMAFTGSAPCRFCNILQ